MLQQLAFESMLQVAVFAFEAGPLETGLQARNIYHIVSLRARTKSRVMERQSDRMRPSLVPLSITLREQIGTCQ